MQHVSEAYVGIDIGGTKVQAALVTGGGQVLAQARVPTRQGPDGVADSAYQAWQLVADGRTTRIGVGVPGVVDRAAGTVAHAVNLGIAEPFALAAALADRTGCPVAVENDLSAAAWGASILLGEDDLAFLGLGTGLAAGLVLDGRLRRGATGAAGEVGHVPVDPGGERCNCGQRGCLELYAAGSRAHDGGRFVRGVADAVRLVALAYDPRLIVLGGGVAGAPEAGDQLLAPLREVLAGDAAASPFLESLRLADRVRLVSADQPVGAIGAALVGTP